MVYYFADSFIKHRFEYVCLGLINFHHWGKIQNVIENGVSYDHTKFLNNTQPK